MTGYVNKKCVWLALHQIQEDTTSHRAWQSDPANRGLMAEADTEKATFYRKGFSAAKGESQEKVQAGTAAAV